MDGKDECVRMWTGKVTRERGLIETVRLNGIELMNETEVGRMAECVTGYIQEVNGEYMKECER